jgi:hypothetical protein
MNVTSVDMYTQTFEEPITFSLLKQDVDAQYQCRTIIGLDAEEIISRFYGWSLSGENRYYDFKLKPRDVVMRIVLNPRFNLDETYSDVRDDLYRAISANRTGIIELDFRSGATTVSRIFGSIIKFEAVHFTNLPEVQITIRCNDPMFRGINPVTFGPDEMMSISPVRIPDSLSTSPHGFTMQLTFTADIPDFTIQDVAVDPEWKFKVIPDGGFDTGDVLHFSSEFSDKKLYYVRGASTVHLADKIESGSIWPILFPGQNEFHFVNLASFDWDSVSYYASYWGV